MLPEETKQLCHLFAQVLDYPNPSLAESARSCGQKLEKYSPGIARSLRPFVAFTQSESPGALEETYTRTFDITPASTLYIGYHLFGETPKRSAFMATLQEAYQSHEFSAGAELPDHLCVLLRFLSVSRDRDFVMPLLEEGILPALDKVEKALPGTDGAYRAAVSSARAFLREVYHLIKAGGTHG